MPETNKTAKTGSWGEDETAKAVSMYSELTGDGRSSPDAVEEIAKVLQRTKRSVQGKLTSEKVYVAPEKKPAAKKDEGPTKKEILDSIEGLGFDPSGLESATKPALERVHAFVASAQENAGE